MEIFSRIRKKKSKNRLKPYYSSNQKTDDTIIKILRPGRKVDIVFYKKSLPTVVRSAMIHDCNHESKTIIISQTSPATLLSTQFEKMGLTTLITIESRQKKRVGVACKIVKFIRDYSLSDRIRENAILIKYAQPMEEFNIRGSYRFEPQINCEVIGKITYNGNVFYSHRDFKVHNISTGGVGLIVKHPKDIGKPLFQMQVNETLKTEFDIVNFDSMEYEKNVFAITCVVWKNQLYSKDYGYVGTRFIKMSRKDEKILHQFVNNGQVHGIR